MQYDTWMVETTNKINALEFADAKIGAGDSPGMLQIEVNTVSGGDTRWLVLSRIDEDAVSFGFYRLVHDQLWTYAQGSITRENGGEAHPDDLTALDDISWAALLLTLSLEVDNPNALKSLPYYRATFDAVQI